MILEQKAKKIQYLNKDFDKVKLCFVRIETLYEKYRSFFSLKYQFYKHLKDGYTSFVQFLLSDIFALTLLIPIINSKSVILAIKLSLTF